jgi:hypothetical protein
MSNTISNNTAPLAGERFVMSALNRDGNVISVDVTVDKIKDRHTPEHGKYAGKVAASTFSEKDTGVIWRVWDNGFRLVRHNKEWLKNPLAESIVSHCLHQKFYWRIAENGESEVWTDSVEMRKTLLSLAQAGVGVKGTNHHYELLLEFDLLEMLPGRNQMPAPGDMSPNRIEMAFLQSTKLRDVAPFAELTTSVNSESDKTK